MQSYLSLQNVIAASGSWMVPFDLNEADASSRASAMARSPQPGRLMTNATDAVSFWLSLARACGYKDAAKTGQDGPVENAE